jgi:RimJ/RimL family protein N-acetyltransferase
MLMPFFLETNRLLIRLFHDSDLESFVAYRNDPEVAKYQGWNTPYTLDQGREFIEKMKIAVPGTVGEWFQAAVELKNSGEMIGDVAFFLMKNDPQQVYLGYSFARPHWSHGYASEAVRRLLEYLFVDLSLHRVVAETDVENIPSIRLLERIGFRLEAHHIENIWFKGSYASEYHHALLRREWESQ